MVGMQMLVEGLAMGAFATLYAKSNDPLLRHLCQLVMTDEAFHHKFGKIWADRTVPNSHAGGARTSIEDWAAECFQTLLFNLANPEQKKVIYARVRARLGAGAQTSMLKQPDGRRTAARPCRNRHNIFRVLIKTLLKAGIITDRTQGLLCDLCRHG